jgi:CRP-like cAMP-binding protein
MDISVKEALYSLKDKMQIFQFFDDEELESFVPYISIANYPSGAVIFQEGDKEGFIGFVISGKLQVKKQTEFKNREIVLAVLTKGSFAGELSMIDGQERTATIKAVEASSLLILKREALDLFIKEHPVSGVKILRGIIHTMAIRQRMTSERLLSFF